MRSYPPQYPHSSTPLNPSPSLFLFFFFSSPPFSLILLLFFSFFARCLFVLFLSFLSFFPAPHLCFFSFPSFLFFSTLYIFLCVCACVYLRIYVRANLAIPCVSANNNVKHVKSNIGYVFDKKINIMK